MSDRSMDREEQVRTIESGVARGIIRVVLIYFAIVIILILIMMAYEAMAGSKSVSRQLSYGYGPQQPERFAAGGACCGGGGVVMAA